MKRFLVLAVLGVHFCSLAQEDKKGQKISWETNFSAALAKASQEHKPVMLYLTYDN